MRFVGKQRLDGEDIKHKDTFDFGTINPHQTFVQEMEANLNSKALVNLGDGRLKPNLAEKMLRCTRSGKSLSERTSYPRSNSRGSNLPNSRSTLGATQNGNTLIFGESRRH